VAPRRCGRARGRRVSDEGVRDRMGGGVGSVSITSPWSVPLCMSPFTCLVPPSLSLTRKWKELPSIEPSRASPVSLPVSFSPC